MKLVLHRGYGGFTVPIEVYLILMDEYGWTVAPQDEPWDSTKYDLLNGFSNGSYYPSKKRPDIDSIEFRSDPELVAAFIKAKKQFEKDKKDDKLSYSDAYYHPLNKLQIVEIGPTNLYIESYNDGHERIVFQQPYEQEYDYDDE